MTEMFAVCVETFFEQSDAFKAELPGIYQSLVDLLQQDPSQKSNPLLTTKP
jgi:Mlc titration factor MtfA (ptsG expression regulator)